MESRALRRAITSGAGRLACLSVLLTLAAPALADDPPPKKSAAPPPKAAPAKPAPVAHPGEAHPGGPHPGEHPHYEYHEFHDRDFHHFGPEEAARWRGGFYRQEWHDGRFGWWWMVDGMWYFYDRPVYPHPLIVSEVVFREPVVVEPAPVMAAPAAVVVQPAPVVAAPQPQMWYWCDNPQGYSPYVQNCSVPWRQVAAQAAPPPVAPTPVVAPTPSPAPAPAAAPAPKPVAKPKPAAPAATNLDAPPPPPPPAQ